MAAAAVAAGESSRQFLDTHYDEKSASHEIKKLKTKHSSGSQNDDKSYTVGISNEEEECEETNMSIPRHPLDIKPLGNAYMSSEDIRTASGFFYTLPEEMLVYLLEQMEAPALVALGATCKAMYAFTRADELWRALYIANPPDPSTIKSGHWRGTWRSTYHRLPKHSISQISCKNLFSDALFRPFHCATLPLHPYFSTIPSKNAVPRLRNMTAAEYVGFEDKSVNGGDTIDIKSEMSVSSLKNNNYVKRWSDRPFILTDVVPHWPAYQEQQKQQKMQQGQGIPTTSASPPPWTIDNLLKHHGDVIFRAEALDWPLRTYVDYMRDNQDESPLYLFDCRFIEKMGMGTAANENRNRNSNEEEEKVNADTETDIDADKAETRKRKRRKSGGENDDRKTKVTSTTASKANPVHKHINDDENEEKETNGTVTPTPTPPPFWPPACFADDLFDVWDTDERPDWRWMIIGPERSGSTFHVDPNGTSAWNAVLSGLKYWILFPPISSSSPSGSLTPLLPPGIHIPSPTSPSSSSAVAAAASTITTPLSIPEYLLTFHRAARHHRNPPCLEALVHPGEVIHVPAGWLHCVLNVDGHGVALTANFVPAGVERSLKGVLRFLAGGSGGGGDISGFPRRKRKKENNNNDNANANANATANSNSNDNGIDDDDNHNNEGKDGNNDNTHLYETFIARLRQKRPAVVPMLDRVLAELELERKQEHERKRDREREREERERREMRIKLKRKRKSGGDDGISGIGSGRGEGGGKKGNEEKEKEKEKESFSFNFYSDTNEDSEH